MAGDEMTWIAAHHPEKVDKLVYLDAAAVDRRGLTELMFRHPALPPVWQKLGAEVLNREVKVSVPSEQLPPPEVYRILVETIRGTLVHLQRFDRITAPDGEGNPRVPRR